ncbi:unnamed protein product [Chrysoparadoxa australica]
MNAQPLGRAAQPPAKLKELDRLAGAVAKSSEAHQSQLVIAKRARTKANQVMHSSHEASKELARLSHVRSLLRKEEERMEAEALAKASTADRRGRGVIKKLQEQQKVCAVAMQST